MLARPPPPPQALEIEKGQVQDAAATLSEKAAGLEQELRAAREQLVALRAVADQGRGDLKSQLQRKDSDLSRAAAAQEAAAAQVDELKSQLEKSQQERERLVGQQAQLQAQLAARVAEGKEGNLRLVRRRCVAACCCCRLWA